MPTKSHKASQKKSKVIDVYTDMEVVSYLYFLLLCILLPVVLFKCIRKTDGCLTQSIILAIAIFCCSF